MTSTASRSETDDDRWFFGKISSAEAATHLSLAGGQDGTFLIRESCSSPGNHVLSFISENRPVDILICNYWNDAFYSLITDPQKIFHGLDNLIAHYTQYPVAGPSGTILCQPCIGDPPPPETRLHGSSNLLHRAVSQSNLKIVFELLKSGYRRIDAKNNTGQTALHIASIKGNEDLVKHLLEAKATVDVRDMEGLTPLQHACRHDYPSIVRLLIEEGKADIQLRTPGTGEVALHEAASCGSLECIKALLSLHAAAWPRSKRNRTPAALAKANQHMDCYSLIVNHRPTIPLVRLPEFYHGKISRNEASKQMVESGHSEGQYLLRKGSTCFVLSLLEKGQVYHYQINKQRSMYYIDDGPYFRCLETLVDHYARFRDGLPCRLTYPVPPTEPLEEREFKEIYFQDLNQNVPRDGSQSPSELEPLLLADDTPEDSSTDRLNTLNSKENLSLKFLTKGSSDNTSMIVPVQSFQTLSMDTLSPTATTDPRSPLSPISPHSSGSPSRPKAPPPLGGALPSSSPGTRHPQGPPLPPYTQMTMKGNKTEEIFGDIDSSSLSVGESLGVGEFGTVLKGIWVSPSGDQIEVAVKTLHDNDSVTKDNFLREAKVMMDLNHPYIVKLLGVCQGPPIAMVQELAVMGSLLNFLLDFPDQIQPDFHFKLWAAQVAEGMNYLEQKHFVHRDLAARNLLLSSTTLVKISDFGLSRALNTYNDYYKATQGGRWPLKWYAPESIYYGQFTHMSDVWSYGITLWEMYTFGDQPYGELTGHEVADLLDKGERLPRPKDCPSGTFNLMLRCWRSNAKKRPTFQELVTIFRGSKDYVNIKMYFRNNS